MFKCAKLLKLFHKKLISFSLLLFVASFTLHAQDNVGIGTTGDPDASAILELEATDMGLLVPRIADPSTAISSPADGLLVYNTTNDRFEYYDANLSSWVGILSSSLAWTTSGNSISDPSTEFIGTTNGQDLVFRTNNTEQMRILSGGNVGIGTNSATGILDVEGDAAYLPAPASEPIDGDLANSQWVLYLDEASDEIILKAKESGGTIISATVGSGGGGNTLDQAYDQGGSGAGRTITIDNGAFELTGSNAADYTFEATNSADGGVLFVQNQGTGSTALIQNESSGSSFRVNDEAGDTSPFVIDGDGNIAVGTTTATGKFNVTGNYVVIGDASSASIDVANSDGDLYVLNDLEVDGNSTIDGNLTTNGTVQFSNSEVNFTNLTTSPTAGTALHIEADGTVFEFTSSKRYKEDITNIELNTEKIYDLRPVSFTWKNSDFRDFGLIAEETYEIFPELVSLDMDGKPKAVRYSQISVLLLNELIKQNKRIEQLEARIKVLENSDKAKK